MRQAITRYVHNNDDELSSLWPPDAKQQGTYHYTLYEVSLEGEVDLDTGDFYIQKVNGVPLEREVSS